MALISKHTAGHTLPAILRDNPLEYLLHNQRCNLQRNLLHSQQVNRQDSLQRNQPVNQPDRLVQPDRVAAQPPSSTIAYHLRAFCPGLPSGFK